MFHSEVSFNDVFSQYPVHKSCKDGDVQCLSSMLNCQPRSAVMEDPFQNWTPIHYAARFGKLDCVRQVASVDPTVINIQSSKTFQTPLHCAAEGGHPHCVLWLIQAGANPEVKDITGETALHKAARVGSSECASLLASTSSSISAQNLNGQTASVVADTSGFPAIATFIRSIELAGMNEFQTRGPQCVIPRRKRMRDEVCGDDFCKRRRTGDDISAAMHHLFGTPDTFESMNSSQMEHDRMCKMEYGYRNILLETLLAEFHGC